MITLKDFPDDVQVLLEERYRAEFFKTAWKISGGYRRLAKQFGVTSTAMLGWRRALHSDRRPSFCPFWVIKEISRILTDEGYEKFELEEIQNHALSHRARHGLKIVSPKIPIADSVDLRQFVMHLICDGSAQNIKHRTCKYDSTSREAVEKFGDLLKIFGDIKREITLQPRKFPSKLAYRVSFPKSIAKILIKKFGSFDGKEARIPKEFFMGDRKLLASVVRAFLIDEGSIRDTRITFTSGNMDLLKDLIKICQKLGYKCCKTRKTWTAYEFSLSSESLKQVYFDLMELGPLPIKDKQKRLDFAFQLQNKHPKDFLSIENEIIKSLTEKPFTNVDLAHRLSFRARTIWPRLKKLEKQGIIKGGKTPGKHGAHIYELL